MKSTNFRSTMSQLRLSICFFADRPKQEAEFATRHPVEVYLDAIVDFFDEWMAVKKERKNLSTKKYQEIEVFSKMLLQFGDIILSAHQNGRRLRILDHSDRLAIEKRAVRLIGELHED